VCLKISGIRNRAMQHSIQCKFLAIAKVLPSKVPVSVTLRAAAAAAALPKFPSLPAG